MNVIETQRAKRQRIVLWVVAIVIVGAVVIGIASRIQIQHTLQRRVESNALIVVATTKPTLADNSEDIMLPGDVQAYADAPIYARTSGYLKRWLVDIGAHVKKGQLLAEIDVPELDQQLLQARAELANAEANARLANSTAERWREMLAADVISKQDTDEKVSDAAAKKSLAASARANVTRLQELQTYKNLVAPFSGVITARNVDIGALVNAASGTELFRVTNSEKLRVYVRAPQYYAPYLKPGLTATLDFAERPGQRYTGKITHSAEAIDATARTLLLQIEVDNASGELLPGSYAQVHLQLPGKRALRLPVNALIFRGDGLKIATVTAERRILLKPIVLGRDFGTEVEVLSGLDSDDAVIVNPPDAIVNDQSVRLAPTSASAAAASPATTPAAGAPR